MSRTINIDDSITLHPSGYSSANSSYSSVSSSYPISNGYDGTSSTNYAYITCNTGSRAESHISYTFNVSGIPEGATINSVACSVKSRVSSTNYLTASTIQLYSGSTAKGSATSAASTTATARSISSTGSWTLAELENIQVRLTGTRGTSNTTRAAYLYFYGADLTINYSIHGTAYTIGATSHVTGVTVDPATQEVLEGEDATVSIYASMIDGLEITDNGTDITNELVEHEVPTGGTIERYPASATTTSIQSGTSYAQYAVGHSAENPYSSSNNMYASQSTIGHAAYTFDFSDIPENAVITNVEVRCAGHRESSSVSSTYVARVELYSGSTQKGSTYELTSTSTYKFTLPDVGTWTRAELQDAELWFLVGYYGGLLCGATWEVTYTIPSSGGEYYWTYTMSNVSADHVILIEESGPFIPPDEDPEYTYYPITISSINATTEPFTGTERFQEGTNKTITIIPTDPQLTLALDNGVDITNQLVGGTPTNTYTIDTQVTGASYGFNLNSSTGYYVSTNNGVSKSASVGRINMNFESSCLVTIQYINYAEEDYDYGMFGKLDTEVATDGLTASSGGSNPSDSTSNYQIAKCNNSTSTQTVTYEVPMGEHFIDVKYGKDDASDSGNDSLQWKVLSVEATSAGGEYTYTLTNLSQKHSLVFIFGDVDYYFITSSGNACKLYPDGQVVKLDGDSYLLRIVPNNANATVTLKDNTVDKTSSLEYEEGQDKSGNKVANYTYTLSNINATHNLVITCSSATGGKIFLKISNAWTQYSKVWVKENGTWVEKNSTTWSDVFDERVNYVKSN